MSETPFARRLGLAAALLRNFCKKSYSCAVALVAFSLATLAVTPFSYTQETRTYTDGPIERVTFETQDDFNRLKGEAKGDDVATFENLEWTPFNEESLNAIDRVVKYFNDVVDVSNGGGPSVHFRRRRDQDGAAARGGGNQITWMEYDYTPNGVPEINTQLTDAAPNGFENTTLHEMGHVMGIGSNLNPGANTVTGEGAAATITFTAANANARVFNTVTNAWENITVGTAYAQGTKFGYAGAQTSAVFGDTWTGSAPETVGIISDLGGLGFGSHPDEPDRSVMSYDYNERAFFTETELAMFVELGGNTIQIDRFFGRSLNQIHAQPINLTEEQFLSEGRAVNFSYNGVNGWTGDGMWGVGLHLVQNYVDQPQPGEAAYGAAAGNTVNIQTHLVSTGEMGTGIRFEGANNTVTIEDNVIIGATGVGGIGVVFAQDSTGSVLNIRGAIDAQQADGTLNLIFGKNADVGDEDYTINIDGKTQLAGSIDLGDTFTLTVGAGEGLGALAMTQVAEGIYGQGRLEFLSGSLVMQDDSTLQVGIAADNAADLINFTGTATAEIGNIDIDLIGEELIAGTFTLLTWDATSTVSHTNADYGFTFNGGEMVTSGRKGGTFNVDQFYTGNSLQVTLEKIMNTNLGANVNLRWSGIDGLTGEPNYTWSDTGNNGVENWREGSTSVWFRDGDAVLFDLTGNHTIELDGPRRVAEMNVAGSGNWTFIGDITADASQSNTPEMQALSGALNLYSTGTTTLRGTGTFAGGVNIYSGTLQIGNGGTVGALNGDITFSPPIFIPLAEIDMPSDYYSVGEVIFNRADQYTYSGNIEGPGSLTKKGRGTLTMNGTVDITGTAIVENGTLTMTGTNPQVGNLGIMAGGTLAGESFGGNTQITANGIVQNAGKLVNFNRVLVNGSEFININDGLISGVRLITMADVPVPGKYEKIKGTFLNSGGYLGAGSFSVNTYTDTIKLNAVGTLTIDGNFVNSETGKLLVGLSGSDSSTIEITNGSALINGGTLYVVLGKGAGQQKYEFGREYTFLTAADLQVNTNMQTVIIDPEIGADPLFTAHLTSDGQSSSFKVVRAYSYSGEGKTENQRAMGHYLDSVGIYPNGDFRNVLMALDTARKGTGFVKSESVSPIDPLQKIMEQLGGSVHGTAVASSFRNTVMMHTTLANVLRREYNQVGMEIERYNAYYTGEPMLLPTDNLWGMVYGHAGSSQHDGNISGYRQGFSGIMAGFDRKNDARLRWGFFLSMGDGSLSSDLDDRATTKEIMLGHYYRRDSEFAYMLLQAGFGTHRYNTRRSLAFGFEDAFINRTAKDQHNAFLITGHLETGLKYQGGIFNFSPYVGLEYTGLLREGFTESGAGSLNLTADREDYHVFRPMFGLRFDSSPIRTHRGLLSFYGNAAWMYEFEAKERPSMLVARFTDAGMLDGPSFRINGNDPGRDWIQAGFGLNFDFNAHLRGFAGYDAFANSRQVLHSANLGLQWQR